MKCGSFNSEDDVGHSGISFVETSKIVAKVDTLLFAMESFDGIYGSNFSPARFHFAGDISSFQHILRSDP